MGQLSGKVVIGLLAGTLVWAGASGIVDAATAKKTAKFNYSKFQKDWNAKLSSMENQVVSDKWDVMSEFSHYMDGQVYYSEPVMDKAHEAFNRKVWAYRDAMNAKKKKIDGLQATLKKVDSVKKRDAFLKSVKGVTYAKGQLHKDRVKMQDVVSDVDYALRKNWMDSERLFKTKRADLYQKYGNFALYSTDKKLETYELNKVKELGRSEMKTRLAKGDSKEDVTAWYEKNVSSYSDTQSVGINRAQVKKYMPYERYLYLRNFDALSDLSGKYERGLASSYKYIDKKVQKYFDKVVKR